MQSALTRARHPNSTTRSILSPYNSPYNSLSARRNRFSIGSVRSAKVEIAQLLQMLSESPAWPNLVKGYMPVAHTYASRRSVAG
jgi:hypothetical protein